MDTLQVVPPEYDDVITQLDYLVVFAKDGQDGCVDQYGTFYTLEQIDNCEYPANSEFFCNYN